LKFKYFHKLASVDFGFWLSKIFGIQWKKVTFFKKEQKNPNFKIPSRSKKNFFGKKFFYEVLTSIRRINVQKISQIGDGQLVTGRMVDSYIKPLLQDASNKLKYVSTIWTDTFGKIFEKLNKN
jgi:hypothetical protein